VTSRGRHSTFVSLNECRGLRGRLAATDIAALAEAAVRQDHTTESHIQIATDGVAR
jgi:hypothetical protein